MHFIYGLQLHVATVCWFCIITLTVSECGVFCRILKVGCLRFAREWRWEGGHGEGGAEREPITGEGQGQSGSKTHFGRKMFVSS